MRFIAAILFISLLVPVTASADSSFSKTAKGVNKKLCKLYGSGGFRGLASYGTGIVVSADGYILTVASPMLDTRDLRVHLYDGRRYHAKIVKVDPVLDVALVKIDTTDELELPHFDIAEVAKKKPVNAGTGVLAFSNQFQIATRDEPMSVQRGRIAAYTPLKGKRGIFTADFSGDVYVIDAITNNPGAGGGALTTRKGELLGLIGKELQNELTNTWINYAIPIQAAIKIKEKDGKERTLSIAEMVAKKEKYVVPKIDKDAEKLANYHGIILVPNVVEFTPPYVEGVDRESPAAKAGLRPDDLIVYVDGLKVASINELKEMLGRISPNLVVQLEVRRGDNLQTIELKMAEPKKKD